MDKQLLKAYIRTIVEEEVERILPKMLSEAVSEIKQMKQLQETSVPTPKQKLDKSKLAQMMGLSYDGETLSATTGNMVMPLPENAPRDVSPAVIEAVTKDYSAVMKKLGLG